jgi:TP901 family phage tail tape measure protein
VNIGDAFIGLHAKDDTLTKDVVAATTKAGTEGSKSFGEQFKKGLSGGTFGTFLKGGLGLGAGLAAVGVLKGGFDALTGFISGSIDAAIEFEDQLATINTVAQLSERDLADLGESIQSMAVESGKSTRDLTEGFYDLVSAGVAAEDGMAVLKDATTLATGALSTTGEAVDLITSAMNSYGLEASETTRLTDIFAQAVQDGKVTASELAGSIAQIAPIAAQAGVSIEEVAAGYATMTAQGVPAAEAATKMRSAIVALISPNAQLNAIQEETGINFAELMRAEGVAVALQTLSDAVGGNEAAMTDALGRVEAYQFALAATGSNADAFATSQERMAKAATEGGVALRQAAERQDTLAFRQQRLAAEMETLMQDLGAALLPVMEGITGIASGAIQAVRGLSDAIAGLVDAAANVGKSGLDEELDAIITRIDGPTAAAFERWLLFQERIGHAAFLLGGQLDNLGVKQQNQVTFQEHLVAISDKTGDSLESVVEAANRELIALGQLGFATETGANRLTLFNNAIDNLYTSFGLSLDATEAQTEEIEHFGGAASEAEGHWRRFLATTEEGQRFLVESNKALGESVMSVRGITTAVTGMAAPFDRAAAEAAILAGGIEELIGLDAPSTFKELKSASEDANEAWKKLRRTGEGNQKSLRLINEEIEMWQRRHSGAIKRRDGEEAAFAAKQIKRLQGEKTARQGLIDAIDRLADAIENLPASTQTRFDTPGLSTAVTNVRLLRDAINSVPGRKTVTLQAVKAGVGAFLHTGGPAHAGVPYVVGERGPEWFVPDVSGRVVNQQQAAAAVGGASRIDFYVHDPDGGLARSGISTSGLAAELGAVLRDASAHSSLRYVGGRP